MKTCHRCEQRFTRESGFDTYAAVGGRVWVCWPCYWKGLKTVPLSK